MENKDLIHKNRIKFMKMAYKEAEKAFLEDEVPIGCIIIDKNSKLLAKSHNRVEKKTNATLHAELVAIQKATKKTGEKYLMDASIFVTLEPCPMCATAISLAKIKNVYIGVEDKKGGAILNGIKIFENTTNLYKPNIYTNILSDECSEILKKFFKKLRNNKKNNLQGWNFMIIFDIDIKKFKRR